MAVSQGFVMIEIVEKYRNVVYVGVVFGYIGVKIGVRNVVKKDGFVSGNSVL